MEKKRPDFFQVAVRLHPDHPWPKALIYILSLLVEFFLANIGHYFGFPSLQT